MATTVYFEEAIPDEGGKDSMDLEIGRSSFYAEGSIYIRAGEHTVITDRATAKRFVDAITSGGYYHRPID